eukprot:9136-Heterococcus_DN1.PRE.4
MTHQRAGSTLTLPLLLTASSKSGADALSFSSICEGACNTAGGQGQRTLDYYYYCYSTDTSSAACTHTLHRTLLYCNTLDQPLAAIL